MTVTSRNYLASLPIINAIIQLLATVSSYVLAVLLDPKLKGRYLPYPSDLMVDQPQRGIFAIGLGISGALTFCMVVLRYIQIRSIYPRHCQKINEISLTFGTLMVLGQVSVPAYSVVELEIVHFIIACIFFAFACLYMATQTHISRKSTNHHHSCIATLRLVCSVIACICPFAYVSGRYLAPESEDRYFIPHAAEWVLVLALFTFLASFSWDFNRIKLRSYNLDHFSISSALPGTNYVDYLRSQQERQAKLRGHKINSGYCDGQSTETKTSKV